MGDRTLIKVTEAGKFIDLDNYGKTMQGWNSCASLPTPTGANFTQGPILTDMRDNKKYEIRKFSDGKCWMVTNLMYGGDTDTCANKSTFDGNGSATPSNQFGPGTYGDCIDPRINNVAPCSTGSKVCGYLYNWQAVMQHATAYYNTTYTGPTTNVQGLCPDGWHLPTNSDFTTLHSSAGSPATGFLQEGFSWNGILSGGLVYNINGSFIFAHQKNWGFWWSITQSSITHANSMDINVNYVRHPYTNLKHHGLSIRCLKN